MVILDAKGVSDKLDDGYFLSRAIIEIVGKPKEHVENTLNDFIKNIEEKYDLKSKDIAEVKTVEESDLFSTFAEIELLTKNLEELMDFVIDYMPASIEVIEPGKSSVSANFLSNMFTELVGRLHTVDMELKKLKSHTSFMSKSLNIMIQNAIMIFLSKGPRKLEDISKVVGIKEDQAKIFLDKIVNDGKIVLENDLYSLKK